MGACFFLKFSRLRSLEGCFFFVVAFWFLLFLFLFLLLSWSQRVSFFAHVFITLYRV